MTAYTQQCKKMLEMLMIIMLINLENTDSKSLQICFTQY